MVTVVGSSALTASLAMTNSTLYANSASAGGGIFANEVQVTLRRSLIGGNLASLPALSNYAFTTARFSINNNLLGHSGESDNEAFGGFTPNISNIDATSDGANITLSVILDSALGGQRRPYPNPCPGARQPCRHDARTFGFLSGHRPASANLARSMAMARLAPTSASIRGL